MTNSLQKKLMKYSLATGAIMLAGISANAQVVYTDVDPDETFATVDTQYDLDLNNDGTVDFHILRLSGTAGAAIRVVSCPAGNEVLGSTSATGAFFNAYALDADVAIDATETIWNGTINGGALTLAWGSGSGNWAAGATDKYLGLRFDIDGATHYGWVRLDAAAAGESFTVKDFAYESTPELGIIAGDMGSPAEDFEVTLNVDMSEAITNLLFDPEADALYATGSFVGWTEPGLDIPNQLLTDVDNDGIYTLVRRDVAGEYLYKYFINDGWNGGEWNGDPNRVYTVTDADIVMNDVFGVLAINNMNANVTVSPNPTRGLLNVTANENFEVSVVDLAGRVIATSNMTNNATTIDLTNQSTGVYIVNLTSETQKLTYKIVIE